MQLQPPKKNFESGWLKNDSGKRKKHDSENLTNKQLGAIFLHRSSGISGDYHVQPVEKAATAIVLPLTPRKLVTWRGRLLRMLDVNSVGCFLEELLFDAKKTELPLFGLNDSMCLESFYYATCVIRCKYNICKENMIYYIVHIIYVYK